MNICFLMFHLLNWKGDSTLVYSKEDKLFMVMQFFAVYSITSIISNAVYSLSTAFFFITIFALYWKQQSNQVIFPERLFNWMYIPFFLLIILSSILLGYRDSILKALDFTYWSIVPFSIFYFGLQKKFLERNIVLGIMAGVLTLCSYALYQYFILPDNTRIQSYLSHPNYLAEMLELSIPFLTIYAIMSRDNTIFRIIVGITALVCCVVLALTACRGGMLGLIVGGLIYAVVRIGSVKKINTRKAIKYIIAALFVFSCVAGTFYAGFTGNKGAVRSYDNERILLLKSSYAMWSDHKVLGVGLCHWHDEYLAHYILPEAREPNLEYPHNTFAYFFTCTGTIGGIGFMFFTFGVFGYLCKKIRENPNDIFLNALFWAFLTIMLHGLVNAAILSKYVMRLYSTYLGIGLASVAYHRLQTDDRNLTMLKGKEDSYENI